MFPCGSEHIDQWSIQSLTSGAQRLSLEAEVHIFIDGTKEVLLLSAQLPGSEDVTDTLMEVRVLALRLHHV